MERTGDGGRGRGERENEQGNILGALTCLLGFVGDRWAVVPGYCGTVQYSTYIVVTVVLVARGTNTQHVIARIHRYTHTQQCKNIRQLSQ